MRIEITGRNVDITPAMKQHVKEKLDHTARAVEDVMSAHVVLAVEKYRHIAEIILHRRRGTVTGHASTRDMYQSIQKAIERIETQGRRKREKVIGTRRRAANRIEPVETKAADEAEPERPSRRVVEEAPDRAKPIGVEEAVLLLEKAKRPFVVFRNAASAKVAVVYQRKDGDFGLVEP